MPIFDWTITLGNVLTVASFIIGGGIVLVGAWAQFKSLQASFTNMDRRMYLIEDELKKQTEILVNQAAARERRWLTCCAPLGSSHGEHFWIFVGCRWRRREVCRGGGALRGTLGALLSRVSHSQNIGCWSEWRAGAPRR